MAEKKIHGLIAEVKGPGELLHAAEKLRDSGFTKFDCHSPYPIHGMDDAMGEKRSKLGLIVGLMALIGGTAGMTMAWWMNAVDYKHIIAGKPFFSFEAFIPITFALAVLFAALTAVFGMLGMVNVKFHHPVFFSDTFGKFSDDGFIVSIDAADEKFDSEETAKMLDSIGATNIELLEEI